MVDAVVGQRIEVGVAHATAQTNGVVLDVVGVEEVFQRGFVSRADVALVGLAVGEEVADVLRPGEFAGGVERGLHHRHGGVVVGAAAGVEAGEECLGGGDIHPHGGAVGGIAAERHQLHFHIAQIIVLVEQGTNGLLGQCQPRQARHARGISHTAGDVEDDEDVGIDLHCGNRAIRGNGFRHIVDDVHHKRAGGAVAQRIGGFVGERFAEGVRPVVGVRRGFWCRGQRVGVGAVSVQLQLPVAASGVADQGVRDRAAAATDRTDQRAAGGFTGIARFAAGDCAGGEILAILAQVEGFFVDRHILIDRGDQFAVGHVDGQRCGAFIAIAVTDGVGERVGRARRAHRVRVAVVNRVARRVEGQVAVVAVDVAVEPAAG